MVLHLPEFRLSPFGSHLFPIATVEAKSCCIMTRREYRSSGRCGGRRGLGHEEAGHSLGSTEHGKDRFPFLDPTPGAASGL